MGWFDNVGADGADIARKNNDGKIYKIVQLASAVLLIVAAAIVIFEVFNVLSLNFTVNGLLISAGMIGLGGLTVLPWVRIFERSTDKRFKITAIVFMAFIGLVVVLWMICVWRVIGLINGAAEGSDGQTILDQVIGSLDTIRVALIVSLQFMVASGVAINIVKYRKTLIPYQVLSGVALLYIDFYASLLLTAITFKNGVDGIAFDIAETAELILKPAIHAIFAVALLILIVTSTIFARTDKRRLITTVNEAVGSTNEAKNPPPVAETENVSAEEKLHKIQSLLDNGLISQEEYDAKRAEIINNL